VFFQYRVIDIREMDGDRLLKSGAIGDNLIAILARLRDDKGAVRKILRRIASLEASQRETALAQLLILAGLPALGKDRRAGSAKNADSY